MIHDSWNSFSVKDLEETQKFYAQVLGLQVRTTDMGILELRPPGNSKIFIYPKDNHQPATFTVLNLMVDNIDKEVDRLHGLGISFERYDEFDMDKKGIVRSGRGPDIAWFKDPSENIISLIQTAPTA